jgi:hypothetical protein
LVSENLWCRDGVYPMLPVIKLIGALLLYYSVGGICDPSCGMGSPYRIA